MLLIVQLTIKSISGDVLSMVFFIQSGLGLQKKNLSRRDSLIQQIKNQILIGEYYTPFRVL